jgi:DNA-binding HxlR family transcriptional regulator
MHYINGERLKGDFLDLISASRDVNPRIVSLPRFKILHSLSATGPDGVTFRELSSGLGITDGLLYSNLKTLEEMGIIRSKKILLGGKELESYYFTEQGYNEWSKTIKWLKMLVQGKED